MSKKKLVDLLVGVGLRRTSDNAACDLLVDGHVVRVVPTVKRLADGYSISIVLMLSSVGFSSVVERTLGKGVFLPLARCFVPIINAVELDESVARCVESKVLAWSRGIDSECLVKEFAAFGLDESNNRFLETVFSKVLCGKCGEVLQYITDVREGRRPDIQGLVERGRLDWLLG